MADASNKFKDLFCEEANDQLAVLSSELLEIEKEPENIERYATLMRAAHTIKGAAAIFVLKMLVYV
jgi:chemotaxis protein histidine kinase CheA